ncbi:MAG: hypothetical protein ABJE47_12950 [bacterium]
MRHQLPLLMLGGALSCGAGSIASAPLPSGGHHVLFIGNSLTYVNDLPATLEQLARTAHDTIRVRMVALPNFALIDHVNGGSNAVDAIRSERWDYVVLQQGPSAQQVSRDTRVLATQRFDPYIHAAGAKSAQFMTWPASDRITAFDSVYASTQAAARAVGGIIFPVGRAWVAAWTVDPTLAAVNGHELAVPATSVRVLQQAAQDTARGEQRGEQ